MLLKHPHITFVLFLLSCSRETVTISARYQNYGVLSFTRGPGSSVGIAIGYGLEDPESNPGVEEIFHTSPDRPWGPISFLYYGYRVFPRGKERPERDADPSPL